MVRARIRPGWALYHGAEANTFTDLNSFGWVFSIAKASTPLTTILKMTTPPRLSCDTDIVDHWLTGILSFRLVLYLKSWFPLIADTTCMPKVGWKKMDGVLSPKFPHLPPEVRCRRLVYPLPLEVKLKGLNWKDILQS